MIHLRKNRESQWEWKIKGHVRRWSLHFSGPFCFNQNSEVPAGEAGGPRNVPAWLKEGDQSKPGAAAQMLCCSVTNAHMNTHAHRRWQWWIRKRSDSLEVIDFPLLHNKLLHDLISLCSCWFSSLNCSFLFFELTLDWVRLRGFKSRSYLCFSSKAQLTLHSFLYLRNNSSFEQIWQNKRAPFLFSFSITSNIFY